MKKNNQTWYFPCCDVKGCKKESSSGGIQWSGTGYWNICAEHSKEWLAGNPIPDLKRSALKREKRRGEDGLLPPNV